MIFVKNSIRKFLEVVAAFMLRSQSRILKFPPIILMYHGISKERLMPLISSVNCRQVYVEDFKEQLDFLDKYCNVVPLDYLCNNRRNFKTPTVAITFDDGYANNLYVATSELIKHAFPATFFICAGNSIERKYNWPDSLLDWIFFSPEEYVEFNGSKYYIRTDLEKISSFLSIQSEIYAQNSISLLESALNNLPKRYLCKSYDFIEDYCRLLNEEEIKDLSKIVNMTIGSHAMTHAFLTGLSEREIVFELTESKKILEDIIGKKVEAFAYPDGAYDQQVIDCVKKAGYNRAYAVNLCIGLKSNLFEMERVGVFQSTKIGQFPYLSLGFKSLENYIKRKIYDKWF